MASKVVSISAGANQPANTASTAQAGSFSLDEIKDATIRAEIEYHVGRIRQSIRRTAWEIVEIGRSLRVIQQRLGWNTFDLVAKDLCGIDSRVARRIISAARFAEERLKDHEEVLENLSPVVVYRLARGDIEASVLDEVIQQASDGKKVMPSDLQAAIDRLQKELEAKDNRNEELESANVELRKSTDRAERARKDIELEVLQLRDQINRHDEEVQRISSERRALMDDLDSLGREMERLKANPIVKEVPKVPKGYASIEEAVKAKEKRLREVSGELQKAEARIADAKRQMAALEGQRASTKASLEALAALEAEIQALIAKCSAAYMDSVAAAEPKAAAKFHRIATLLRKLADQIERAAERPSVRRR